MKFKYNENNISYNKEKRTFTAEASSLELTGFPRAITLVSPHTNRAMDFIFQYFDREPNNDAEYPEVLGAWYHAREGFKLLVIND